MDTAAWDAVLQLRDKINDIIKIVLTDVSKEISPTGSGCLFSCEPRPMASAAYKYELLVEATPRMIRSVHAGYAEKFVICALRRPEVFAAVSVRQAAFKRVIVLRLGLGPNSFRATSKDFNSATRIYSVQNQPCMSSADHPQEVHIRLLWDIDEFGATRPILMRNPSADSPVFWYTIQMIMTFLRCTRRLSPQTLAHARDVLFWEHPELTNWPYDEKLGHGLDVQLQSFRYDATDFEIYSALLDPYKRQYAGDLDQALNSNHQLVSLDTNLKRRFGYGLSLVDGEMRGKWLVIIHHPSSAFWLPICLSRPSFTLNVGESDSQVLRRIHILDTNVREKWVMVLPFSSKPSDQDIESLQRDIARRFVAGEHRTPLQHRRWISSQPIFYSHDDTEELFRCDGFTNWSFLRQRFAPVFRVRDTSSLLCDVDWRPLESGSLLLAAMERPGYHFIFWCRVSVGKYQTWFSMAVQLWAMLRDFPEGLVFQPNDTITIVLESCSSARHSWQERNIKHAVAHACRSNERRIKVFIAWPDCITRRASDVHELYQWLKSRQAVLYFRAQRTPTALEVAENEDDDAGADAGPESIGQDDFEQDAQPVSRWCGTDTITEEDMERILSDGMDMASELPRYTKNFAMLQRIIDAKYGEPSLVAVAAMIKDTIQVRCIRRIVVYARVSPDPKKGSVAPFAKWEAGIELQLAALKRFIPDDTSINIVYLRQAHVSAAKREHERDLLQFLADEPTCVLTTSIDRIARNPDTVEAFSQTFIEKGHIVISFLWDWDTLVSVEDALGLSQPAPLAWTDALQATRSFTPSRQHLTLLVPILWIGRELSADLDSHVYRHLYGAVEFTRTRSTASSGVRRTDTSAKLPKQLIPTTHAKFQARSALTPECVRNWEKWVQESTKVASVKVIQDEDKRAWNCACVKRQECEVRSCRCDCKFCRSQTDCACAKDQCYCPEVCSCNCEHCHLSQHIKPKTKQNKTVYDKTSNIDRIDCAADDCNKKGNPTHKGFCWIHYNEYLASRRVLCDNPDCGKEKLVQFAFCSLKCYLASTPIPRLCKQPGCRTIVPVGFGKACNDHGNWSKILIKLHKDYEAEQAS